MLRIYYLLIFFLSGAGVFSNQKYARSTKTVNDFSVYALITGVFAVGVFFCMAGFNVRLNLRTCCYAIAFAVLIFLNYFASLALYKFMGIAERQFIVSGLSIILTILLGVFFYSEDFKLISLIQLILILLTFLAIFLSACERNAKRQKITFWGITLCVAEALIGALCRAVSKSYAGDKGVTDENSFFFITNIFIVLFAFIAVYITNKGKLKTAYTSLKSVSKMGYLMIGISVLGANITSVLEILILREGDLVLYAPLRTALNLIAGETVAIIFAKEKPRIIATVLAVSSVVVVVLF